MLKRGPTEALIGLLLLHNLLAKGIVPGGNAVAKLSANSVENYSITDEKTSRVLNLY